MLEPIALTQNSGAIGRFTCRKYRPLILNWRTAMRTHILAGLLTACTLGLATTASAQSYVPGPVFDGPISVVPHQDVIVREREYIVSPRPVAPAPVVYARPVPVPYARTLVPAAVEVEPYVAVPLVRRPYFGPRW